MSGRDVPPYYESLALAADTSRAASVKLFCLECCGYQRADVTNCTATQCPLWLWRPYQEKPKRVGETAPQPLALRRQPVGMGVDSGQTVLGRLEADFRGGGV